MALPGFESSVNSYDSQTIPLSIMLRFVFESSVNSYDSQITPFAGKMLRE